MTPRFIEQMPMSGGATFVPGEMMSAAEVREAVAGGVGAELRPDGLGHPVVGENAVDVVVERSCERDDLDHHVEIDALRDAPFGLEGADLDLADMVPKRDAVAGLVIRRRDAAFGWV